MDAEGNIGLISLGPVFLGIWDSALAGAVLGVPGPSVRWASILHGCCSGGQVCSLTAETSAILGGIRAEIFDFPQTSAWWEGMQSQTLLMRLAGGLGLAGSQTPSSGRSSGLQDRGGRLSLL